jgi:hypothetical protein
LIERPRQGGRNFLRKHESARRRRFSSRANDVPISDWLITAFEDNAATPAQLRGIRVVYDPLTIFGKDRGHVGQKHRRATARPKPVLIRIRCIEGSRRTRNGEQPWL